MKSIWQFLAQRLIVAHKDAVKWKDTAKSMKLNAESKVKILRSQVEAAEKAYRQKHPESGTLDPLLHEKLVTVSKLLNKGEVDKSKKLSIDDHAKSIDRLISLLEKTAHSKAELESIFETLTSVFSIGAETPKDQVPKLIQAEHSKILSELKRLHDEKTSLANQVRALRSSIGKVTHSSSLRTIEKQPEPIEEVPEEEQKIRISVATVDSANASPYQTARPSFAVRPIEPTESESEIGLKSALSSNASLSPESHRRAYSARLSESLQSSLSLRRNNANLQEIRKSIENLTMLAFPETSPKSQKSVPSKKATPATVKLVLEREQDEESVGEDLDLENIRYMSQLSLQQTAKVLSMYYQPPSPSRKKEEKKGRLPRVTSDLGLLMDEAEEYPDDDGLDINYLRNMTKQSIQRTADLVKSFYSGHQQV